MNRRTFLKEAGAAAAGLAGAALFPNVISNASAAAAKGPNILVIMVDQLRFPQAAFNQGLMDRAAPNLAQLRKQSVSFDYHFAAATACSPSRSTIVTGLYTHQNGMFLTNAQGLAGQAPTPSLDPRFPTFGSILRKSQFGMKTWWWGKWHLSLNDQLNCNYVPYGFEGNLPCPSPNGGPAQGFHKDPETVDAFRNWIKTAPRGDRWCTTVSLVNPHDVQWYPKYSMNQSSENNPPPIPEFHSSLPPNFERWPEALFNERKPTTQFAWLIVSDGVFGPMPTNPGIGTFPENWYQLLDLYYLATQYVDIQIGEVLKTLQESPFANNTIVVFTSDHGEYAGAHGLHGKAFSVYDESIRVPLYVWDPTGTVVPKDQAGTVRSGLTSHVDLTPLLMTMASGSNAWRQQSQYRYLSGRADLVKMLRNPNAKGRDYILHTSDEDIPEEAPKVGIPYKDALVRNVLPPEPLPQHHPPTHVIGMRTKDAKLGVYAHWKDGTIQIEPAEQQAELYDYANYGGNEVINNAPDGSAPEPALFDQMYDQLMNPDTGALGTELRAPLHGNLKRVHKQAVKTYLAYEATL